MLELKVFRKNPAFVEKMLEKRNFKHIGLVKEVLLLDSQKKRYQQEKEKMLQEINQSSKEIAFKFSKNDLQDLEKIKEKNKEKKKRLKDLEEKEKKTAIQLLNRLESIPNLPDKTVKKGQSAQDNELIKTSTNTLSKSNFTHWQIGEKLGWLDFKAGAKISGSGFLFYKGQGAKIQRALISFFLDQAIKNGYTELQTPLMVNPQSAYNTGQIPDKDKQMYQCKNDDLYLIPTAEVPLTNLYADSIIPEDELPIQLCAYSPCFRREAGSYGKDVKGLNRLHQFDKVEIVSIVKAEASYEFLEKMLHYIESLLILLELDYRVLNLCSQDLGFTAAKTYDLEVWSPGQKKWLEVSSVTNFETFQSNRMGCRYKNKMGAKHLVHTLNGSALALPRVLAALLEKGYSNGQILFPNALKSYL